MSGKHGKLSRAVVLTHLSPDDNLPTCLAYTLFTAKFQAPFLRVQDSIKESHLSSFHSSKQNHQSHYPVLHIGVTAGSKPSWSALQVIQAI